MGVDESAVFLGGCMQLLALEIAAVSVSDATGWYTEHGWHVIRDSVQIGHSALTFVPSAVPCTYHYAITVPVNAVAAAARWCRTNEIPIIAENTHSPIHHFGEWGMEAVYFRDGVGNIVEFIGLSDAEKPQVDDFDLSMIYAISEIGLVTDDVVSTAKHIKAKYGLSSFHSSSTTFEAVGTNEGRIIVVQSGREWFPKTGIAAQSSPVHLTFLHDALHHSASWVPFEDE